MSKRDKLRALIQKLPSTEEIDETMTALRNERDISVAIVASAILEAKLEDLIAVKFLVKGIEFRNEVFSNQGPLTSFHSKILIAQAFGIITTPMAKDLRVIKNIRNVFAHAKFQIAFSHTDIAKELGSLAMIAAIDIASAPEGHENWLTPKAKYLLAVQIFLIMFDGLDKHDGTADKALAELSDTDWPKA